MTTEPARTDSPSPADLLQRGHLTTFLMDLAAEVGADAYMLVAILHNHEKSAARILASNWIHDAIEIVGTRAIAAMAEMPAAAPGTRPHGLVPGQAPQLPSPVHGETAKLLDIFGHRETFSLRLSIGRHRCFLLLSAGAVGQIDVQMLTRAQIKSCYALSRMPGLLGTATAQPVLSERERECLAWVSEGKTTEEIAVILGVSANTVNGYVTNACQKLASNNRAMAIATAVRGSVI